MLQSLWTKNGLCVQKSDKKKIANPRENTSHKNEFDWTFRKEIDFLPTNVADFCVILFLLLLKITLQLWPGPNDTKKKETFIVRSNNCLKLRGKLMAIISQSGFCFFFFSRVLRLCAYVCVCLTYSRCKVLRLPQLPAAYLSTAHKMEGSQ